MTAVLSAIAFVLAFFEFPVPLSPSFARMDLSDLKYGLMCNHAKIKQSKGSCFDHPLTVKRSYIIYYS